MAFSNQSTKLRLLKLLQHSWSTQPNTTVSLSELAQTLNVSRERVRQLYHQLAVEYALPPIQKRKLNEINQRSSDNQTNKLNTNGEVIRKLRTPSPQTLALEADVRKYISQNMSVPEIARKIGRPAPTIYTALQRLDIPFKRVKDTGRRQRNAKTLAIEALVRKYSEQGLSVAEIVRKTGRSESNIERIHHRLHIPLPPKQKSPQTQELEALVCKYSEQGLNAPEIARKIGRPLRTIYYVLRRLHIPRKYTGAAVRSGKNPKARALEDVVRMFSGQGMTPSEIAESTGKPVGTIYHVLRRLGLPYIRKLKQKSPQTQELEALVRKYSEQGLNAPEIARKIGKNRKSVYSVFRRLGLPFKWVKVTELRNPKTHAFDAEVKWYYFSLGMSSKEIASITRRDMKTVYAALHRLGVPLKKQSRRSG